MNTEYIKHRNSLLQSINTLKGVVVGLSKSTFLSKDEKQAAMKVVDAFDELQRTYRKNRKEPIKTEEL
jgi:hypothetical protein